VPKASFAAQHLHSGRMKAYSAIIHWMYNAVTAELELIEGNFTGFATRELVLRPSSSYPNFARNVLQCKDGKQRNVSSIRLEY